MSKFYIVLGAMLAAAALVVAGPATAKKDSSKAASGGVKIQVHTHSNDDPDWPGLLFSTDRLEYDFEEEDDFSYSSRPCGESAPFNEVGLDFRPNYPGIDDDGTAAVRHGAQGTVISVKGDRGTIEGTITSVLCVTENDVRKESEHVIVTDYRAKYRRTSDNEIQLTGRWRFDPDESTGTFEDLRGHGSFKAILTCLAHVRNPSQPTCEDRKPARFTDFVGLRGDTTAPVGETTPGLMGHYKDPTIETR